MTSKLSFYFHYPLLPCLHNNPKSNLIKEMTFSEVYASVLSPFVKNYEAAKNEKGRKAVVSNAADAVRKSRNLFEDKGDFLPKSLEPVCLYFFSSVLFHSFSS